MMDDKTQQLIDKQLATIEKAKPIALRYAVGDWAVHCFKNNTPLSIESLKDWSNQSERKAGERKAINDFITELDL